MSIVLRILLILGALAMLCFVLKRIRVAKLKIEHALFWIVFSAILVVIGIFPQIIYFVAEQIGFMSSVSMVFLCIIGILIIKVFLMTIQISHLEHKVDSLVQQIAISSKKEEKEEK